MLKFDFETYNNKYVNKDILESYKEKQEKIKEMFYGNELSHWMNTDTYITKQELLDIKNTAANINKICDVFIVIGIGGSYMGAKAVIEALSPIITNTQFAIQKRINITWTLVIQSSIGILQSCEGVRVVKRIHCLFQCIAILFH
jgi:glucose-6-phosphate isomerase